MAKVLHASKSGYFPFCLTNGVPPQTGKGTLYPISLPLTQYMSWWWKVKTWKLTGNSAAIETATPPDGDPLVNNWTTTGLIQDDNWTLSVESEKNLVCQGVRVIKSNADNGVGYNGYSTGTSPQAFTNTWTITFETHAYLDESTIYPRMYVQGWFDTYSPGDPKVQAQLDPVSSFRIDGILIPTYINWFPQWAGYSNWSVSGTQSFDLTPETYWAYA